MAVSNIAMQLALLGVSLVVVCPAQGEQITANESLPQKETDAAEQSFKEAAGLRVEPHPQGETVGVLGRLYEQRLLVKAQVELMNAQAELKTKGATTANIDQSYAPTVKMVQGVDNSLFATFLYPGNMTMDARVGDTISGGYKVLAISVNQVVLSKDGERIRLGFSASPPTPLPSMETVGGQNASITGRMSATPSF
jgi:type IV pilus biogenesis protein PilP